MTDTGTTWLICGSGPSAPRYFDAARRAVADLGPGRYVGAAVNASWQLWRTSPTRPHEADLIPDCYFVSDQDACRINRRAVEYLQGRGVPIVTLSRTQAGLELRQLQCADIMLLLAPADASLEPGKIVHSFSGGILLQFAIQRRARTVVLVGFDGYRSTYGKRAPDTFDGVSGSESGMETTQRWYGPQLNQIFNQNNYAATGGFAMVCGRRVRAGTRFIVCGQPTWKVEPLPNVIVVEDPADISAAISPPPMTEPKPAVVAVIDGPLPTLADIVSFAGRKPQTPDPTP